MVDCSRIFLGKNSEEVPEKLEKVKREEVKREKGRRLYIQRENSRGNSSERAIDCKIIEILRFIS